MKQYGAKGVGMCTFVYTCVAMFVSVSILMADGFRNPPEGAAALGRGGARIAYGDDATAITHNPANLMDLRSKSVMPTFTIGYSSRDYTSPLGMSEESEDPWTILPALYASWPVQEGKSAAGIAVTVPYGQASKWDDNGLMKYRSPYYAEMMSVNVNPTLATRLGEDVTIGAGVDLMWSSLKFRQDLPPADGIPGSRLTFEGDGYGFGGNAGITWQMTDGQRLALVYRSPISVDYEGDFSSDPAVTQSSDFKTTIDFPSVVGLGYGLQATKTLRIQADVEWVEHSRNKSMDLDIGNNNALLDAAMGSRSLPQNWEDTWTFGVGADWSFATDYVLRAGWTYLPSPVPDETLMPTLAESDKNIIGIGLGYHGEAHALDVGYAYNICKDRTVDSPRNPVQGNYEFEAHLISASYSYLF